VASATNPNCNSHFSFEITAPSPDWTQYYVPYAALTQQYGGTATWNPQLLLGVTFAVGPGAAFDVWVDDISFYLCSTAACQPTCVDPAFPVICPASGRYPVACRLSGTDCSTVATWCSDPLLIDDMEDDNNLICNSGGRSGTGLWYTDADGTEGTLSPAHGALFTMTPIPGGRGDSRVAARMTASGFNSWAQMGVSFNDVAGMFDPYDVSPTSGITFWMKTDAPNVLVTLAIPETVPVSRGGLCSDNATTYNCDNNFGFYITSPHPSDWFQYYVPYSALSQGNWNYDVNRNLIVGSASWDPTMVTNVQFAVGQPQSTELWIDDISFYDCANEPCRPTCTDPTAPVACEALGTVPAGCWPAGTDCSSVTPLLWDGSLNAIWGSAAGDVWTVGSDFHGPSAVILHGAGSGAAWSPSATDGARPLGGVWGSGSDDVWAVGDFGTVLHWDGTGWTPNTTVITQASLSSVWGAAASDIWAVGANGTLLHFDGRAWSAAASVSSKTLYRAWGSGPNDVWAVGDAGTILHYDGSSWSASVSGTDSILYGVWGSSSSDVWAVGNATNGDATILHGDGQGWSAVSTPAAPYPNGVWGSGPDDVWVVGEAILHWNGAAWSTVASPTTEYLAAVWGTGPNDAWIVGNAGTLLHWDGTAWSAVPTAGIQ
jgi:hypothetical protein